MEHYVYALLDPRKPGNYVYKKYNFDFEPFYIGISKNEERFTQHLRDKSKNKEKINKINKIIKEGKIPIFIKIKEKLIAKKASILEVNLIKTIGRKNFEGGPLLNYLKGGQITSSELISLSLGKYHKNNNHHNNLKVLQFDINDNLIKEWKSGAEAAKELGISKITACCRGERKSAGGFVWKYKTPKNRIKYKEYKKRTSNNVKNKRKVVQYDMNGNLLKEFDSILEASKKLKIHRASISNCCNGIQKTAGNFKFKHK